MFHAFISVAREVSPLGVRSKLTLNYRIQTSLKL